MPETKIIQLPKELKKETLWFVGDCEKDIRVKLWKSGFSIKCMQLQNTIVSRPYSEDNLKFDLANFCCDCSKKGSVQSHDSQLPPKGVNLSDCGSDQKE